MQLSKRGSAALITFSSVCLSGIAASPAYAVLFKDINGRHCDTSELIDNPQDPTGPSVCPGGLGAPGEPSSADDRRFQRRQGTFMPIWGDVDIGPIFLPPPPPETLRLGMFVTPDSGFGNGVAFGAGGFSARSSGVGVTDSAGLVTPGSVSTASRTTAGTGGISGSYDASNFVGSNQRFILNGAFDYTSSKTNFSGASGSINSDTYAFKGSALYTNNNTYLVFEGDYEFGNNSEFFAAGASSGSYRSDGYTIDARLGHVFVLFNTIVAAVPARMSLKAPPRAVDGGYGIGLDLSGHLGYVSNVARGFTDSSGFVFGDERVNSGETGLRAKLFAEVHRNGVTWTPYVSGSVDWLLNYSHVAYFPTQLAMAGGDALTFADGTTFVGTQAGLDVQTTNGWTVGVNGFYARSSDTEIAGGRAYVKIPFGPAMAAARY
jgi:hypothetical protein